MLHYVTLRYITLYYVTLRYITLPATEGPGSFILSLIPVHYITLLTLYYITLPAFMGIILGAVTEKSPGSSNSSSKQIPVHYIKLHYITSNGGSRQVHLSTEKSWQFVVLITTDSCTLHYQHSHSWALISSWDSCSVWQGRYPPPHHSQTSPWRPVSLSPWKGPGATSGEVLGGGWGLAPPQDAPPDPGSSSISSSSWSSSSS